MNAIENINRETPILRAFGHEVRILLSGEQTGGNVAMLYDIAPPGAGSPPHYHEKEDEWFYVLSGEVEFYHDNQWIRPAAGTAIFIPRMAIHAFRNVGTEPLHMLITVSPAGFDKWFERCAHEFNRIDGPNMSKIAQWAEDLGMHFVEIEDSARTDALEYA